jgi:hypothetical protein
LAAEKSWHCSFPFHFNGKQQQIQLQATTEKMKNEVRNLEI